MLSPDVNVLVSIFREDADHHDLCRDWIDKALTSAQRVAISELVLSGTLRILTHPRIFIPPSPLNEAMLFITALLEQRNVTTLRPSSAHWRIFSGLCEQTHATGNRIPDAYHAALAIEQGCQWVTLDRGFGVFPGLQWKNLLVKQTR